MPKHHPIDLIKKVSYKNLVTLLSIFLIPIVVAGKFNSPATFHQFPEDTYSIYISPILIYSSCLAVILLGLDILLIFLYLVKRMRDKVPIGFYKKFLVFNGVIVFFLILSFLKYPDLSANDILCIRSLKKTLPQEFSSPYKAYLQVALGRIDIFYCDVQDKKLQTGEDIKYIDIVWGDLTTYGRWNRFILLSENDKLYDFFGPSLGGFHDYFQTVGGWEMKKDKYCPGLVGVSIDGNKIKTSIIKTSQGQYGWSFIFDNYLMDSSNTGQVCSDNGGSCCYFHQSFCPNKIAISPTCRIDGEIKRIGTYSDQGPDVPDFIGMRAGGFDISNLNISVVDYPTLEECNSPELNIVEKKICYHILAVATKDTTICDYLTPLDEYGFSKLHCLKEVEISR